MAEESHPRVWWHTIPGILTAIAAVITAVTGLIVVLQQAGVFEKETRSPSKDEFANRTPAIALSLY
jgi:hypothetical protein